MPIPETHLPATVFFFMALDYVCTAKPAHAADRELILQMMVGNFRSHGRLPVLLRFQALHKRLRAAETDSRAARKQ